MSFRSHMNIALEEARAAMARGEVPVGAALIGPDGAAWDIAFIAEYPSVAAFVGMLRDPDYRNAVRHRQASVADSRLIRMRPGTPGDAFGAMTMDQP